MLPLLFAALFPALYWDQPVETAPAVKQAGVMRLYVPADRVDAWKAAGFMAIAFNPAKYEKATSPGVQWRMNEAAATNSPWVDANGWQFQRRPDRTWYYEAAAAHAALSAAEPYTYGVDAVVRPEPADLETLGAMLAFLRKIDRPHMPAQANIGIIDDGTDQTAEVLNLLARRNLLFRVVPAPDSKLDLNIRMPQPDAADPFEFAVNARRKLTDDKRLVRLYGSEVVLAHLTGDDGHARLHLLNYSGRKVSGLRVRLRGNYGKAGLAVFGVPSAAVMDWSAADGAVEFTIPEMQPYAVVDLERK